MNTAAVYSPDRSLKGKLRRRLARVMRRRPARIALDRPMISFTFDDAPASAFTLGRSVLEAKGVRATYYVAAGLAGQDGPTEPYGDRDAILAAAAAGHEIACHTHGHLDCGKAGAAEIEADVIRNEAALRDWGLPKATNFAYPFGDVSPAAKAVLGSRYDVLRALHHGLIVEGTDLNQAPAVGVEGVGGEAAAHHWLERAAAQNGWLLLYTHDVSESPSEWGCTPGALERLIAVAQTRGFDIVTLAEGARRLVG
jgi:peptidoglycan/xylan/chitin deacetylase (PgdA/CDA1 family)